MPAATERQPRRKEQFTPRFGLVSAIYEPGKYTFVKEPQREGLDIKEYINIEEEIDKSLVERFPSMFALTFNKAVLHHNGEYSPASVDYSEGIESKYGERHFIVGHDNVTEVEYEREHRSRGEAQQMTYSDSGIPYVQKNQLVLTPTDRDGKLEIYFSKHRNDYQDHAPWNKWSVYIELSGEKPGAVIKNILETINRVKKEKDLPLWKDYRPDLH